MISISRLVFASLLLATTGPAHAQASILGEWHGVLNTPSGTLRVAERLGARPDGRIDLLDYGEPWVYRHEPPSA